MVWWVKNVKNCVGFKLLFLFAVGGCVSISEFSLLVRVPVVIASSAVKLKICAITTGIKKYKSIISKKRKKHDKIVLLAKTKLDKSKFWFLKLFIDSHINHDEFVLVNKVPRQYNATKEEIRNPENAVVYTI